MFKVPSTNDLRNKAQAGIQQQDNYLDSLLVQTFDDQAIKKLAIRVAHLTPTPFKQSLERAIKVRKDELKPSLEDQKMQLERNKDKRDQERFELEGAKHLLEQKKQEFNVKLQTRKFEIQFTTVIFSLVAILLIACGVYANIFQAPQFAVPAGGSIKTGTVEDKYYGIGGAIILASAIGGGALIIGVCCGCSCCKIKIRLIQFSHHYRIVQLLGGLQTDSQYYQNTQWSYEKYVVILQKSQVILYKLMTLLQQVTSLSKTLKPVPRSPYLSCKGTYLVSSPIVSLINQYRSNFEYKLINPLPRQYQLAFYFAISSIKTYFTALICLYIKISFQ